MKNHEACIDALNDLIRINNDRIEGYQKAIEELKGQQDDDLEALFSKMIEESREYKTALADVVRSYGGTVAEGTMASGKLFRAWMDIKAFFKGGDRETVLNSCEAGEDAARKAYQMALDDEDVLPETKQLISTQQNTLRQSHDKIRSLRDAVAHSL